MQLLHNMITPDKLGQNWKDDAPDLNFWLDFFTKHDWKGFTKNVTNVKLKVMWIGYFLFRIVIFLCLPIGVIIKGVHSDRPSFQMLALIGISAYAVLFLLICLFIGLRHSLYQYYWIEKNLKQFELPPSLLKKLNNTIKNDATKIVVEKQFENIFPGNLGSYFHEITLDYVTGPMDPKKFKCGNYKILNPDHFYIFNEDLNHVPKPDAYRSTKHDVYKLINFKQDPHDGFIMGCVEDSSIPYSIRSKLPTNASCWIKLFDTLSGTINAVLVDEDTKELDWIVDVKQSCEL